MALNLVRGVLTAALVVMGMTTAKAQLTNTFRGNVTSIYDSISFFGSSVRPGQSIEAIYQETQVQDPVVFVDEPFAYWRAIFQGSSPATISAGDYQFRNDSQGWVIQAFDSHQVGTADGLRFYAFDFESSYKYAIVGQVAIVGDSTLFDSDAFRADWRSALTPDFYPFATIYLTVLPKVYDEFGYTVDFSDVVAEVRGSVDVYIGTAATPVPESSTYALSGMVVLAGLVVWRKVRRLGLKAR